MPAGKPALPVAGARVGAAAVLARSVATSREEAQLALWMVPDGGLLPQLECLDSARDQAAGSWDFAALVQLTGLHVDEMRICLLAGVRR